MVKINKDKEKIWVKTIKKINKMGEYHFFLKCDI